MGINLLETAVDFSGTTMPDGIVATRDLSDDPETKRLVTSTPVDTDEEIEVTALNLANTNDGNMVSDEAVLEAGDAVAVFTLDDLPNGANDSYRITVEVMVGGVNLGTVVIARRPARRRKWWPACSTSNVSIWAMPTITRTPLSTKKMKTATPAGWPIGSVTARGLS